MSIDKLQSSSNCTLSKSAIACFYFIFCFCLKKSKRSTAFFLSFHSLGLFTSHEVDMATFPSLTEKDLCEIGITAWGARRKIMLLISGT